jgi:V/A-type H+-transporting ATPase subunit D
MAEQVAPTKSNLLRSRRSLRTAVDGYALLDRKRNVLIRELMAVLEEAKKVQVEVAAALAEAFGALRAANIAVGAQNVEEVASACEEPTGITLLAKSVMGAWTPSVARIPEASRRSYSFRGTAAALDEAVRRFRRAAETTARAAALETTVIGLAQEIRRTQKRANALHNVLIPRYREQIKFISESLEERDREDFFKVKQVKRKQDAARRAEAD